MNIGDTWRAVDTVVRTAGAANTSGASGGFAFVFGCGVGVYAEVVYGGKGAGFLIMAELLAHAALGGSLFRAGFCHAAVSVDQMDDGKAE